MGHVAGVTKVDNNLKVGNPQDAAAGDPNAQNTDNQDYAQAPPPPPAAPAAAAPYDPSAAPQLQQPMMPPTGPVVRLSSDNPVARLQMMQLKWRDVCTTPCGVAVDPNGTFRIGGGTIRPSEEFRMPRPAGTVLVKTQIGSIVKHWVGFGMILSGAATVLGGLLLY